MAKGRSSGAAGGGAAPNLNGLDTGEQSLVGSLAVATEAEFKAQAARTIARDGERGERIVLEARRTRNQPLERTHSLQDSPLPLNQTKLVSDGRRTVRMPKDPTKVNNSEFRNMRDGGYGSGITVASRDRMVSFLRKAYTPAQLNKGALQYDKFTNRAQRGTRSKSEAKFHAGVFRLAGAGR